LGVCRPRQQERDDNDCRQEKGAPEFTAFSGGDRHWTAAGSFQCEDSDSKNLETCADCAEVQDGHREKEIFTVLVDGCLQPEVRGKFPAGGAS
jgi:hypothetical protein